MAGPTLLLNADCQLLSLNPLSSITWQDAIKLEVTGDATAIDYYEDWVIHSPSTEFMVPAVLRLNEQVKVKRAAKFCTRNLFLRDNYTCQYCGEKFNKDELTKDHVLPRKLGGKTTWTNIVTACKDCNHSRGHNTNIQPMIEPYKPSIYELEAKTMDRDVHVHHPTWLFYLPWSEDRLIKTWDDSEEDRLNRWFYQH